VLKKCKKVRRMYQLLSISCQFPLIFALLPLYTYALMSYALIKIFTKSPNNQMSKCKWRSAFSVVEAVAVPVLKNRRNPVRKIFQRTHLPVGLHRSQNSRVCVDPAQVLREMTCLVSENENEHQSAEKPHRCGCRIGIVAGGHIAVGRIRQQVRSGR
jgi:hypothetical protein